MTKQQNVLTSSPGETFSTEKDANYENKWVKSDRIDKTRQMETQSVYFMTNSMKVDKSFNWKRENIINISVNAVVLLNLLILEIAIQLITLVLLFRVFKFKWSVNFSS